MGIFNWIYCGKKCQEEKTKRYEIKYDYKEQKQEEKTERTEARQERKSTAYENGVDPNAWLSQSLGGLFNMGGEIFGRGGGDSAAMQQMLMNQQMQQNQGGGLTGMLSNPLVLVGIAVLAFFGLKKR